MDEAHALIEHREFRGPSVFCVSARCIWGKHFPKLFLTATFPKAMEREQDIYERYWDLDTTFGKWNLDSAKKKMAHTKFLTVHFETGTIPPIYVLELVV